jgi:ATP-dependent Clp protease ATP-binding subunit ClpA
MPKINVYLPDGLAEAVREAQLPVSAICQSALESAVRDVTSARGTDHPPIADQPSVGLFGRFTPRARQALVLAERAARELRSGFVSPEHLLLGMIDEGHNVGLAVLGALDIDPNDLRAELIGSMPPPVTDNVDNEHTKDVQRTISFGPLAKRSLELTAMEARSLGHNYVGCEHVLLGVLATEESLGSAVMRRIGLELRTTRRAVVAALAGVTQSRQSMSESKAPNETTTGNMPSDKLVGALNDILQRLDAIERRLPGSA